MFRGNQAREDAQAAGLNGEIMIAAAIFAAANLQDHEAAAFGAVFRRELFQHQNAVRQALQLRIVFRAAVIQQQRRAFAAGEILFQGQDLAAIAQGRLRQQPQLGDRIENDARRLHPLHFVEQHFRCLRQLDFRGMEKRVLRRRLELRADRRKLDHIDTVERPAVGIRHFLQLIARFRQRDVEHFLARFGAREKILQRQSRLARARFAFEQIEPVRRQPAAENIIQPADSGRASPSLACAVFLHLRRR